MSTGSTNPPGWYPDPYQPGTNRWWDGTAWTAHSQPAAGGPATPAGPGPRGRSKLPWIIGGVALAAVAIIAAAVVLLGGDDTATPEEFAASVCEGWVDDARELNELSEEGEAFEGEPSEEQFAALADFLRTAGTALDELSDEFEGAGRPDVTDGEQVVDDVASAARETADQVREFADQVEAADPDDPDALDELNEGFEEIDDSENDILDGVFGTGEAEFGDFGNDELGQAFADDSTCQEINELLQ